MALFERFRRRDLQDADALAAFVDGQSHELARAAVHDYCRLRAGEAAAALAADVKFATAAERATWEAYPCVLAMIATLIESALRPHAGDRHVLLHGLSAVMCEGFDRRPVPDVIGELDWRAARADLQRNLNDLARRELKAADAVVLEHASSCLAIMPLHPLLKSDDYAALCALLRQALTHMLDGFTHRANLPALAACLAKRAPAIEIAAEPPPADAI